MGLSVFQEGKVIEMPDKPKVVIVGAGFGGLWAARAMAGKPVEVILLDRHNYHNFFPLLYQVAAAELEPEDIIYPVRSILRRTKNVRMVVDMVTGVDTVRKEVITRHRTFSYDYLVLALGSTPRFFGIEGADQYALPLRTIEDAVAVRNHILLRFERALYEADPQVRRRLLTFAIIGGGATGVEFAGALAELIFGPLCKDYAGLDFSEVRFLLLEGTDRLLPGGLFLMELEERMRDAARKFERGFRCERFVSLQFERFKSKRHLYFSLSGFLFVRNSQCFECGLCCNTGGDMFTGTMCPAICHTLNADFDFKYFGMVRSHGRNGHILRGAQPLCLRPFL